MASQSDCDLVIGLIYEDADDDDALITDSEAEETMNKDKEEVTDLHSKSKDSPLLFHSGKVWMMSGRNPRQIIE